MPTRDGLAGWGWVTRLLHWTMAALLIFQLGLGLWMTRTPDLLLRFDLTQTHKSWGTVIFALAMLRLFWRAASVARPPLPASMPRWQVRAAVASHALLYLLMFVLPVSGWVLASASPAQDLLQIENLVFGRWPLPDPWVPGDRALEAAARVVHRSTALALAALVVVHVTAALRHQFVARDGLLVRMIRGR